VLRVNTILNSIIAWGQTLLSLQNVESRIRFYFGDVPLHFRPFSIEKTDRIAQKDLLWRFTKVLLLSSFVMADRVYTLLFHCCHVRVERKLLFERRSFTFLRKRI
jgi:hypothetical protein